MKKVLCLVMAIVLAAALAVPAAAKGEDDGVRWLDIELPEMAMMLLGSCDISYIEETDRLCFYYSGGEQKYVYDLKRGREVDEADVMYLSDSLLVEGGWSGGAVTDLKGNEIPWIDDTGEIKYYADGIYSRGSTIFNSKGEVLSRKYTIPSGIFSCQDGYIAVEDDSGRVGVMDLQGDEVLPCRYDSVEIRPDSEGLFVVEEDGAKGVVDAGGRTVVPLVSPEGEGGNVSIEAYKGLVAVNYGGQEYRTEVYDRDGELILSLSDAEAELACTDYNFLGFAYGGPDVERHSDTVARPNSDGYIFVRGTGGLISSQRCRIYDRDGKPVLPEGNFGFTDGYGFSHGLAVVWADGKDADGPAIVDKTGKYVVSPGEYDSIYRLGAELFAVEKDGTVGVIDGSGKTVVEPEEVPIYSGSFSWRNGWTAGRYFGCYYITGEDGAINCFINEGGKVFRPEEELYEDPTYMYAYSWHNVLSGINGYFPVYTRPDGSPEDQRCGVVDANRGEMLIEAKYDRVVPCSSYLEGMMYGKYFVVRDGDRLGLVTNPHFGEERAERTGEEAGGSPAWLWICLGVVGAAAVAATAVLVLKRRKTAAAPAAATAPGVAETITAPGVPVPPGAPTAPAGTAKFCGGCGARLAPGQRFCPQCGKKV